LLLCKTHHYNLILCFIKIKTYAIMQPRLAHYIVRLLVVIFATNFFACNKNSVEKINPSLLRVYINESKTSATSVIIEEVKTTTDNGYLFIGVIGNNISTKFSKNAALYLMKIDASGNLQWEKSYETVRGLSGGFLSNVLATDKVDEFVFVWNRYLSNTTFEYSISTFTVNASTAPTITPKELKNVACESNLRDCGFVSKITRHFDRISYALLSIAETKVQGNDGHVVFLSRTADSNDSLKAFSSRSFTGLSAGIDALFSYDSRLFVAHNNNAFYYNIPVNAEEMALQAAGNSAVYYKDSTVWASAALNQATGKVSVVFSAKSLGLGVASYLATNYDLLPTANNSNNIKALATSLEPQFDGEKKVILYRTEEQNLLIMGAAGSTETQGILIHILAANGQKKDINLASSAYLISGVAESQDGKTIAIGGNQRLTPTWSRPFLLLISKSELLRKE
jgi:hypothetical protein